MHLRLAPLLAAALLGIASVHAETRVQERLHGTRDADLQRMEARARVPPRRKSVMIPEHLVTFRNSPFPFEGMIPGADKPFLEADPDDGGRLFHQSPRGGKLYLDTTYNDRRSLIYASRAFDPAQPDSVLLLFFHGNESILQRDVVDRQGVLRQLAASRLNAVLVAPQMAVDARDSTAGHFYDRGFFEKYLGEAAAHIAAASKGRVTRADIDRLPVLIVAYSGGYVPTIVSLRHDLEREHPRILGVVLLDGLFGDVAKYEDWINRTHKRTFFVSAYTDSCAAQNLELRNAIQAEGLEFESGLPSRIGRGTIAFESAPDAVHKDFVTDAWITDPLALILKRIRLGRD